MALCHLQLAAISEDCKEDNLGFALNYFEKVEHAKGIEVTLCMLMEEGGQNGSQLTNQYMRAHSFFNEYEENIGLEKSVYKRRDPSKEEYVSILRELVLERKGAKPSDKLDLFPGYSEMVDRNFKGRMSVT